MTDQNNYAWASGATYNAANQPLNDGTATRAYNRLHQMTSIVSPQINMTYTYSPGSNNGQIASSVDAVSGETITYKYDALKRLSSATAQNWGETYTYDGYGNLTQMSPSGTAGAPALSVTVALDANGNPTNRISATGVGYDNNGNQTAGFGGLSLTYDAANRLSAVGGSQSAAYAYGPDNRRIYHRDANNNETIYFYGADGKKLATYTCTVTYGAMDQITIQLTQQSQNLYFLGKLIVAEGNGVSTDRLGSVRNGQTGYEAQYPYGVEYTTTANDREKYATYTRDSVTGLDYAVNRYYSSQWGRFLSPDPYRSNSGGPGDPADPQSWNRYTYTRNDPVNRLDPTGLNDCEDEIDCMGGGIDWGDPNGGGSGGGRPAGPPAPCSSKILQPQYLQIYADMGKDLNVNPLFIMAVSLQESGWNLSHVYGTNSSSGGAQLNNLFGTTYAGGNNIPYPTVQASAIAWELNWGNYLKNPPQTIQAFTQDLTSNPVHMYNTNPTWPSSISNDYDALQTEFNDCNTKFPSNPTGLPQPPRPPMPRPRPRWETR
jgi:RHS repeat-associated protein